MKHKYLIIVAITIVCWSGTVAAHTSTSKAFFSTAEFTLPNPLEYQHFWDNDVLPEGNQKQITLRLYGARSTNSKSLANYFGPFEKESYVVKEDITDNNVDVDGFQDIMSYNFNLVTADGDFHSIITFKPHWTKVGIELGGFFQYCKNYWLSVSAPLEHVKTDMNLTEEIKTSGSGARNSLVGFEINSVLPVGTMTDAFKQEALNYGKIDGSQSTTKLAHIECTFGMNKWRSTKGYAQPYFGITIPTGNKPKGVYMFEPIVGNNRHFAFFGGMHFGKKMWESENALLFMSGSCQSLYRAPNTQVRSFDPGGKPWGRYITVANSEADIAGDGIYRWGIDHFTKTVKVRPHFTNTLNCYLHALLNKCTIHIGYHGTVQSTETVTLHDAWSEPAISSLADATNITPARGINNLLDNFADGIYQSIKNYELNMNSAAHNYHFNHTISASASCQKAHKNRLFTFNGGAAITTGTNNNALRHWSLWSGITADF